LYYKKSIWFINRKETFFECAFYFSFRFANVFILPIYFRQDMLPPAGPLLVGAPPQFSPRHSLDSNAAAFPGMAVLPEPFGGKPCLRSLGQVPLFCWRKLETLYFRTPGLSRVSLRV
jgi:hypothetical protein